MSLRYDGRSLSLQKDALEAAIPRASGKLLILVHGLCMNDLQWARDGHDHGAALAADLGYTPIHLHYNSGLHVSTNGREFADLLESLVREWPQPVEEIVVVAHSMGGLVARSACHYGGLADYKWVKDLRKMVFLGTPHHGSHLERLGNWVGELLHSTSYSAPFARLGMNRSQGITDLRHGFMLDEDWDGIDRFARGPDTSRPVSLPDCVQCYAIGATWGSSAGDAKDRLMGDGLVPLDSALGLHQDCDRELPLPPSHTWVGYNMGHLDLLNRCDVYEQIREWLLE